MRVKVSDASTTKSGVTIGRVADAAAFADAATAWPALNSAAAAGRRAGAVSPAARIADCPSTAHSTA